MKTNPNHPSAPAPHQNQDGTIQHDVYLGLTKREEFAKAVMIGIWSSNTDQYYDDYDRIAKMAVKQADVLINELNKEE